MSSEPRWKIFSTPSTRTSAPLFDWFSLITFSARTAVPSASLGRRVHDHAFAGSHARAQLGIVVLGANHRDGAAFGAAVLDDEHHVPPVPALHRAFRKQHRAARRGRPAAGFAERHLHRHLRQDARVQLVEADAHLDRGFLAVGSGDDGDDVAGNFPVGICIQRGFDRLAGLDPVDVAFVDVNFDFQRFHVHDGADAGAGEAAAGRYR